MPSVKAIDDERLVLVVDDDPDVRESISELLDTAGYSTVQAANGQKALEILKDAPRLPCLVVLDLAMPIIDGYRFLRLRAQDPTLRKIPVVVTSATPPAGPVLKEIDSYLAKPVDVDLLMYTIERHC